MVNELPSWLSYAWVLFVLPLKWLWSGLSENRRQIEIQRVGLENHRLHSAENHFSKAEVAAIVKGTVEPMNKNIDRIDKNIKKMEENLSDFMQRNGK